MTENVNSGSAVAAEKLMRPAHKPGWWSRRRTWQKVLIIALTVIVAAGGALAYWAWNYAHDKLDRINKVDIGTDKELGADRIKLSGYTNILCMGVDSRDLNDVKGSRTDCLIIISINQSTGGVYLTSVYRDTYLRLADLGWYDKITHAFAYGGLQTAVKSVNEALDLDISKYLLFNFKTVTDFIDRIGGVDVELEDYELDELNRVIEETARIVGQDPVYIYRSGTLHMDGVQAVSYGRMRSGVGDDFKRTERMRDIVTKMLDKVKKLKLREIDGLIDDTLGALQTNFTTKQLFDIASNIFDYHVTGSDGFPYSVDTGMLNGISYVFPTDLENDVRELHRRLFPQLEYEPSDTLMEINERIRNDLYGASPYPSDEPLSGDENHLHDLSVQGYDESGHWLECSAGDGFRTDTEPHVDADNDGFCDVCGYQMSVPEDTGAGGTVPGGSGSATGDEPGPGESGGASGEDPAPGGSGSNPGDESGSGGGDSGAEPGPGENGGGSGTEPGSGSGEGGNGGNGTVTP